jgi:pectate lyase
MLVFAGPGRAQDMPIEGFGAATTGGAGQPDCVVTSLDDSGTGSLRECLAAGNRFVHFAVAGTIHLMRAIDVPSNVTVDGLTGPPPGITITNRGFQVFDASNIIMRGLRIRDVGFVTPSDPIGGTGTVTAEVDCISVAGAVQNVVFDRMSIYGCGDGAIDISSGPKDITIQWSILSTWKGALWGSTSSSDRRDTDRISMHHSAMICNDRPDGCDRFPLIRASGFATRVDLRRNIFEGWIRANGTKIESPGQVNVVGNAYVPRADATFSQRNGSIRIDAGSRVYTAGNLELGAGPQPDLNDNGTETEPFPAPAIAMRDLGCVLRDAGVQPRDEVDQMIVSFVPQVPTACAQ